MKRCDICGNMTFDYIPHKCLPRFRVRQSSEDDEWKTIFTISPDGAAEEYTAQYDMRCADYPVVGGRYDLVVDVVDENGRLRQYRVKGEMIPDYIASEINYETD